jgi:hypothetical protein
MASFIRGYADMFRHVFVCCGDWQRVLTNGVLTDKTVGVFLDPPYHASAERDERLYGAEEDMQVAAQVVDWCIANQVRPGLRLAVCGYTGDCNDALAQHGWAPYKWKAHGGMGNQYENAGRGRTNCYREVIWFSPTCLTPQPELF